MNHPDDSMDNNMDNKIKDWAQHVKPAKRDNREAAENILRHLRPHKDLGEERKFSFTFTFHPRPVFALAALAVVLLAAGMFVLLRTPAPAPGDFLLGPNELAEIRTVAGELDRLFPEGIQWAGKRGDHIDIRAGQSFNVGGGAKTGRILLSFHLLEKKNNRLISAKRADIIVWNEEPVEMNGEMPGKDKNVLWVHHTGDNHVFVSMDMAFPFLFDGNVGDRAGDLRVRDKFLLALGTGQKIAEQRFREKVYEVHQSAYRL